MTIKLQLINRIQSIRPLAKAGSVAAARELIRLQLQLANYNQSLERKSK